MDERMTNIQQNLAASVDKLHEQMTDFEERVGDRLDLFSSRLNFVENSVRGMIRPNTDLPSESTYLSVPQADPPVPQGSLLGRLRYVAECINYGS